MTRRRVFSLLIALGGLVMATRCGNQQECALNSDCLPGRFCSDNNFCEFQCRGKEDCEGCGVCDLRYGVCVKAEPADFGSLAVCCARLIDKAMPMSTAGICLSDADGGVDAPAAEVGDASADVADQDATTDGPDDDAGAQ